MVDQRTIERIREMTDIVSVIEEYFPLRRVGANYKALCPFHQEKTPSFIVSPEKQIFHCFGCAASGNVYNFIMKHDGISFMEAVKQLATKTGVKLDYRHDKEYLKKQSIKEKIFQLNKKAADYYNRCLLTAGSAKGARDYLKKRGINSKMLNKFNLGYAPRGNTLVQQALHDGVDAEVLVISCLAGKDKSGKLYDKFSGRLIFPIFDERGQVRGFGGRVLDDNRSPKYLNTAQNEVFEKRKIIYGLYQGKEEISRCRTILILEGYMDVIAAHQYGLLNAVATLGTALTSEHIYKLKHFVSEIILAFDSDEAGSKATLRGLDLLLESELRGRVCVLPKGTDPEDIIRKNSNEFIDKVNNSAPLLNWRIDYSLSFYSSIQDASARKIEVARDIVGVIERIKNPIKKQETVKMLSERISVTESAIQQEIMRHSQRRQSFLKEKLQQNTLSREERILKELFHIIIRHPEYIDEIADIKGTGTYNKNNKNGEVAQSVSNAEVKARGVYYNMIGDFIEKYNGDVHKMMQGVSEDDQKIITGFLMREVQSGDPYEYLIELKKNYLRYIMEKKYLKMADQIKTLINTKKPVSGSVKKEYNKLKSIKY